MPEPRVVFADEALPRLKSGWDMIADTLALTLGPRTGYVLVQGEGRPNKVDRLSDSATIARRIVEIPGREENVGAMMMRHMAWRVHEEIGDGSATMAVLAQKIFAEGYRCIVAGSNPMILRKGIERATEAVLEALQEMAQPVEGEDNLAKLATSQTGDPELGKVLGEMLDVLGTDGSIVVEEYMGRYLEREYVDGVRYKGGYASMHFITDPVRREVVLQTPHILVTDHNVERMQQIVPLLEQLAAGDKTPLVVISPQIQGPALATLILNNQKKVLPCAGVKFTSYLGLHENLQDVALITGARFLTKEAGHKLEEATLADLGSARRVIAKFDEFMIVGGHGDRVALRERIRGLRARWRSETDTNEKGNLRTRLGHLTGGIGILKFGTDSEKERKQKREEIDAILEVLSASLEEGIVPGGGVAYLECIPAVRELEAEGDEAVGIDIVARALDAPIKRIIQNAGQHPPIVLARAQRRGNGYGYDILTGEVVNMEQTGIMDSARVLRTALSVASSGACLALTPGALILKRNPEQSMEP
ncbi:MAG: chaperonin GroEL [Anaerolineae bacterium]|nr:chaperonin GroEL [Anaerolineae bacterium]